MSVILKNSIKPEIGFKGGFTVLMAVYRSDNPNFFKRALNSVFENTLQPNAMILVVDGPVPNSLNDIIHELQLSHPSVRVHRLDENKGLAHALNEGLSLVETDWVARADADDINHIDRFSRQAAALANANPPLDLIGSAIQEIDHNGRYLSIRRTVEGGQAIRIFSRRRNPFNHNTVVFRTNLVRQVGGYPIIHLKEDYALWASLLSVGARVDNLPDILVDAVTGPDLYRRRGGLRYALAEIELQRHLVKCKLKKVFAAIVDGMLRSAIFIFPSFIRAFVYKQMLRKLPT